MSSSTTAANSCGCSEVRQRPATAGRLAKDSLELERLRHETATGGSYDWLFVLDGSDAEYLLEECFPERRSVRLRDVDRLGAVAESG
jgi:hypothetical protein